MFKIPQNIQKIITVLESNGFEAYIVGGAVRDLLLKKSPSDYDIATSCPAKEILNLFDNCIPTGIKHGTVTVIMDNVPAEVTTFRIDGKYNNNRSPESVEFTKNINEDLSRRDFTINAFAYSTNGSLIDLFDGKQDLNNRIIKTVGNPDERFKEDALRILRAIRFSCELGFSIEENTYNAALKHSYRLSDISGERILAELTKTLLSENLDTLESFIKDGGLNSIQINSNNNLSKISNLPYDFPLRLFALLIDTKANLKYLKERLKLSNDLYKQIFDLCFINDNFFDLTKEKIKLILQHTDILSFKKYITYKSITPSLSIKQIEDWLDEIIVNNEPYTVKMLNITGNEIEALGFKGEKIGDILNRLLRVCQKEPDKNNKKTLIKIINDIFTN